MDLSMEILETPWRKKLLKWVSEARNELIICAPYFSEDIITQILDNCKSNVKLKFILGFTKESLEGGQSEPNALLKIIDCYPDVVAKQVENLHAKVYIFDGRTAILTSSNPTFKGLEKNIEFGVCVEGEFVAQVRERVMAYWSDPNAVLLDNVWLQEHKALLKKAVETSKKRKEEGKERIGKLIVPKGLDVQDGAKWAILWSTHEGKHIKEHRDQIREKGATLWGTDFWIKPKWFTFPTTGYLYITRRYVAFKAIIAEIDTSKIPHKARDLSLRPARLKDENNMTYLKLTKLEPISPIKATQFRKHDGQRVSKYGIQRYVRVFDPEVSS